MGAGREQWLWIVGPSDRGKRCIKIKPARLKAPWRLVLFIIVLPSFPCFDITDIYAIFAVLETFIRM